MQDLQYKRVQLTKNMETLKVQYAQVRFPCPSLPYCASHCRLSSRQWFLWRDLTGCALVRVYSLD